MSERHALLTCSDLGRVVRHRGPRRYVAPVAPVEVVKTWGAQEQGVEIGFYSEANQRLDAMARDLERRAQWLEENFTSLLRDIER